MPKEITASDALNFSRRIGVRPTLVSEPELADTVGCLEHAQSVISEILRDPTTTLDRFSRVLKLKSAIEVFLFREALKLGNRPNGTCAVKSFTPIPDEVDISDLMDRMARLQKEYDRRLPDEAKKIYDWREIGHREGASF